MTRKKKEKQERQKTETDPGTTFADMNVEGFRWYDPSRKNKNKSKNTQSLKVTRKEYWAMVRGALAATFPFLLCVLGAFLLTFAAAYLWLK